MGEFPLLQGFQPRLRDGRHLDKFPAQTIPVAFKERPGHFPRLLGQYGDFHRFGYPCA